MSKPAVVVGLEPLIYVVRGKRVMLDHDLAVVYGVKTLRLNEQVKRNIGRFPPDFVFRLTKTEYQILISQNAISSSEHGGRRRPPYAFTEHGAVAAAFVLKSPIAMAASVQIVRAFNRLRRWAASRKDFRAALDEFERQLRDHRGVLKDHADKIQNLFDAIREISDPVEEKRRQIGFKPV